MRNDDINIKREYDIRAASKMNNEENRKLAIAELQHSMSEWALRMSNHDQNKFRSKAIKQLHSIFDESSIGLKSGENAPARKFPESLAGAYEHVLRHDDMSDYITTYSDSAGLDFEPYYRCYDQHDKSKVYDYKIKPQFKGYTIDQLDPFNRFTYEKQSKEEWFFCNWFVNDDEDSSRGLFMEAVLACHAIRNEKCHSCKCNGLRWNGGGNSSWQDLFCVVCKSTYEVKTKATTERVENAFKHNNIQGGSYYHWHQLSNEELQPEQKRFLVVLPRLATFNRKMLKVYPVYIAEFATVLPKLYPGSFNLDNKNIKFKSRISIKVNTKAKWFDLPSTDEWVDCWDIAERVFIERFSHDTFGTLMDKYFGSEESGESATKSNANSRQKDGMEDIVQQLKDLEVPDDWEDLDSDED